MSHFFARCASPKTHGHAKIARVSRAILRAILACPCVFLLAQRAKRATKSDTSGHCIPPALSESSHRMCTRVGPRATGSCPTRL